jgi:glucuronokinase
MGGLVAMDFSTMETNARFGVAHGRYEAIDPELLPPLFLAHRLASAEPSGVYHSSLRARFDAGDPLVRSTLKELAGLVVEGRAALRWRNHAGFAALVGQNMELRRRLGPLPEGQLAMVDLAAELGAPATFAGSGGAIVGVMTDPTYAERLGAAFATQGVEFFTI